MLICLLSFTKNIHINTNKLEPSSTDEKGSNVLIPINQY